MKILKFKTNIENKVMLDKLTPILNSLEMVSKWKLDLESDEKILSVSGDEITPDIISKAINQIGAKSEMIHVVAIGGHDL